MNIILFSKNGSATRSIQFTRWYHIVLPAFVLFSMVGMLTGFGYYLGSQRSIEPLAEDWQQELLLQKQKIESAKMQVESDLDALTRKVGEIQGHITRLDALGNKLVKMAGIDASEFDFSRAPAVGGPQNSELEQSVTGLDLISVIEELEKQIAYRGEQLQVLDEVILTRNLQKEVQPAGRPITKGWTSSYYGMRTDPFTGKPEFHRGMDFAGKQGSDVVSVAAGVVTWAGKRYGYGNMVEVNHGNGHVTRYGHGDKVLVEVGDVVKQGDLIMKMGSTGRSTGPHVHFEVLKNGRHVDPAKFIRASR
jgi:murein DD-endopeptidase MepM/ murein hydrolase activator NlpD